MTASASTPETKRAEDWRRWSIVAAVFVVQLVITGSTIYSFGVLVKPMAAQFHAGRATISLIFFVFTVTGGLLGPFVGAALSRWSIRGIMLVGSGLIGAGFMLLGLAGDLWQAYFGYGVLVGAGNLLAGGLACSTLIVNWFERERGLALGLSIFGASAGAPLFVTFTDAMVETLSWRWTALAFSALTLCLLPPAILLLVRDRPLAAARDTGVSAAPNQASFLRAAASDPRFWIATAFVGFSTAPSIAVVQTLHSHLTDIGFSPGLAAAIMAGMTLLGALAKPTFGRLGDRFGVRALIATSLALQAGGLVTLALARHLTPLTGGTVLYGLGYGGLAPLVSLLLSRLYGPKEFPRAIGLMAALLLPFNLAGFPLASWIEDQTGSYSGAYLAFLGFLSIALLALAATKIDGSADGGSLADIRAQ